MKGSGVVGFLLAIIFLGSIAHAEEREAVRLLLEKMSSASQFLNYTGTFTFVNGPKSWTMQVVHSFDKHGEREYLKTIAGEVKEIYRDDRSLISVARDKELVLVESTSTGTHQASQVFDRQFNADSDYYDYYLDGTEEIAGYSCQVVSIVPKDQYRYGYRLCLEDESGLLIKSQVVDKSGQPKERLVFSKLEFPTSIPSAEFNPDAYNTQLEATPDSMAEQDDALGMLSRWRLTKLPPGFVVVQDTIRNISGSTSAVRHIVLDDGIAAVSVFIKRPANGEKYLASKQTSGALNTLLKIKQGAVITVIGEAPKATINAVYSALAPEP
jgi:sigma-E factor negative regulatory protein RseB